MKFLKYTGLLLQSTKPQPKLNSGLLRSSISLVQTATFPAGHPAARNVWVSSYGCSCTAHSHMCTMHSPPNRRHLKGSALLPRFDFCSSPEILLTANHIHCRHFWSRFKSTDASAKDSAKESKAETPTGSDDIPEEQMTLYQRFKHMYKNYWYVLIPVHVVTSIGWGGMFYYIASSGFDIAAFLETVGASQKIVDMMRNSPTGYVAVAYTMYKIATPVRYSVTLGGTTMAIKHLVKHGLIKPVDRKKIQQMYSETKDQLMEKRDTLKENIMEKRSRVLSQMSECKKELSKSDKK